MAILLGKGNKAKAEAAAAFDVAHYGVGFDAAFLDEEVELRGHAFLDFKVRGLDEQAVDADVQHAGDIIAPVAAPADPDIFRGQKAS